MAREEELDPVGGAPAWMATYSDTMTLLMTFFVLLLTFSYISPLKNTQKDSGISPHKGSGGIIGKLFDSNALLWRDHTMMTNVNELRSQVPPKYAETSQNGTKDIIRELEDAPLGDLSDSFRMVLPIRFVLDEPKRLSLSAKTLFDGMARNLRQTPYDLHISVAGKEQLHAAIAVTNYFVHRMGFRPNRLAIGISPTKQRSDVIRLTLARQT